jgi:hypothetical protein
MEERRDSKVIREVGKEAKISGTRGTCEERLIGIGRVIIKVKLTNPVNSVAGIPCVERTGDLGF